jgi:hypothetical protein
MAHFVLKEKRISKQEIGLLKKDTVTVGLWGPMNTFVNPPKELEVVASPAGLVTIEKGNRVGAVREWKIAGVAYGLARIEAKAGTQTWDSFHVDVVPRSYRFLTQEKRKFIAAMARAGRQKAKEYNYPLSAMIACACGESGFGTSAIYKRTGSPFNLQKPADWEYPKCETEAHSTENKPGEAAKPAPFCKASSLNDASRLWCEWIAHHPREAARNQLLSLRDKPKDFAASLFLVNFANSSKVATKEFGVLLERFELQRFD